jgi:hypothetical protein
MNWALLIGLIGIALAIFFGLWGFRRDISGKLSDIRDKVISMGVTLEKAWDILRIHFAGATGTVERTLKNLGKTTITAKPEVDKTTYIIIVDKPVLQEGLIIKLSKETELENREKEMFGGQLSQVYVSYPNQMRIVVPCVDPRICTEFISMLLKWLDSIYFNALPRIKDYEESIQV